LTDLKELQITGWRTTDTDTIPIGNAPCVGMEGDSLGIEFDIAPGSMGELLVVAADFSGNRSCVSHYVFAVPLLADSIPPPPGTSDLTVEYYDNADFTGIFDVETDSTIQHLWGDEAPFPGMDRDTFSVRWTGQLRASSSGVYRICVEVCKGDHRLWLAGSLFSENTASTGCSELCEPVGLTAGDRYDFVLEYRHTTGTAYVAVRWLTPTGGDQIIPPAAWR